MPVTKCITRYWADVSSRARWWTASVDLRRRRCAARAQAQARTEAEVVEPVLRVCEGRHSRALNVFGSSESASVPALVRKVDAAFARWTSSSALTAWSKSDHVRCARGARVSRAMSCSCLPLPISFPGDPMRSARWVAEQLHPRDGSESSRICRSPFAHLTPRTSHTGCNLGSSAPTEDPLLHPTREAHAEVAVKVLVFELHGFLVLGINPDILDKKFCFF
jgi:hypothetical protein